MHYTSREVYEFVSRQTNDPIIQWKTCTVSGTQFPIYQSDLDFYAKVSPTFAGQKFQIPTPTLCPEERSRRRLNFRNERNLYRRKCDYSGKDIISIYSPDKPYKVYEQSIWWSDARDPMNYGMDFDFSKSFTENFRELIIKVPRLSLINMQSENSEYCNPGFYNKDCYLGHSITNSEGCSYGRWIDYCTNCFDCLAVDHCENCSNSVQLRNCFNCHFSCQLTDCSFCRGCVGLVNKQYCINNEQYKKDEYFIAVKNFQIPNPIQSLYSVNNTDVIDSNIVFDCEKCKGCFDIRQSSDLTYCQMIKPGCHDCTDATLAMGSELNYEVMSTSEISHGIGLTFCREGNSLYYCDSFYHGNSHCFACIGLRNKQYCIFNKQYTKEEYEIQVAKIIAHMQTTGEWGEFFHPSLSLFGYNETVAQEYYPLIEGELTKFGYKWSNYSSDPKIPDTAQVLRPAEIDDESWSKLVHSDDIVRQVIICEVSGRPYMIQKAELEFYRKHQLPIPRKHPDIRHEERMKLRPERTLHLRICDKCEKEMLSVYETNCEGKIYCDQCYQKEVFG